MFLTVDQRSRVPGVELPLRLCVGPSMRGKGMRWATLWRENFGPRAGTSTRRDDEGQDAVSNESKDSMILGAIIQTHASQPYFQRRKCRGGVRRLVKGARPRAPRSHDLQR